MPTILNQEFPERFLGELYDPWIERYEKRNERVKKCIFVVDLRKKVIFKKGNIRFVLGKNNIFCFISDGVARNVIHQRYKGLNTVTFSSCGIKTGENCVVIMFSIIDQSLSPIDFVDLISCMRVDWEAGEKAREMLKKISSSRESIFLQNNN